MSGGGIPSLSGEVFVRLSVQSGKGRQHFHRNRACRGSVASLELASEIELYGMRPVGIAYAKHNTVKMAAPVRVAAFLNSHVTSMCHTARRGCEWSFTVTFSFALLFLKLT